MGGNYNGINNLRFILAIDGGICRDSIFNGQLERADADRFRFYFIDASLYGNRRGAAMVGR